MKIKWLLPAVALFLAGAAGLRLFAHCQIPCGIYDDPARFTLMEEHVTTIEKSMKEIIDISLSEKPNWNQATRWVHNKEHHADELSRIATFYFMAQRVKPADPEDKRAYEKYIREVTLLHQTVFYAMKAKQTTDLEYVTRLRSLIKKFKASYLGK